MLRSFCGFVLFCFVFEKFGLYQCKHSRGAGVLFAMFFLFYFVCLFVYLFVCLQPFRTSHLILKIDAISTQKHTLGKAACRFVCFLAFFLLESLLFFKIIFAGVPFHKNIDTKII